MKNNIIESQDAVLPALVPVGCNIYTGHKGFLQYCWLVVEDIYEGPTRNESRWTGARSRDFDRLIDDTGWQEILEVPWRRQDGYDWRFFLLAHGIAPGQSFLVRLRCLFLKDYWGDCAESWYAEVVAKAPMRDEDTLTAWTKHLVKEHL